MKIQTQLDSVGLVWVEKDQSQLRADLVCFEDICENILGAFGS